MLIFMGLAKLGISMAQFVQLRLGRLVTPNNLNEYINQNSNTKLVAGRKIFY